MNDDLFALLAYNRWADNRVVEAVRALSPEQYAQEPLPGWSSVRASLVHIAGATDLWARRLAGEPVTGLVAEADVPTLDDAIRLLNQGHDAFDRLLSSETAEHLASIWISIDPRGNERRFPFWVAYRHVVNHATYHRGQLASKLKRFGVQAPFTDFVFWAVTQMEGDGK